LVREENQDRVLNQPTPLGVLLVVADGIGGYEGGARASGIVVESVREYFANLPPDTSPEAAVQESIARANTNIFRAARAPGSPHPRMGSTVVLALVQRGSQEAEPDAARVWIGHVGDSRAYLVRDGRLTRLTRDHSAVQELLDQDLITPEEAANHPDSSVLTRSLGHDEEVEVDIRMAPMTVGDGLLLCSDGLWGYVEEENIASVAGDLRIELEPAVRLLLEFALAVGGYDNVGIELARIVTEQDSGKNASARGSMTFLAVALVALGGLGVLAWYAATHNWLQIILHPH
jgi:protein phosphatase